MIDSLQSPAEMSDGPIITRFAPSPTGALHVGGARTALFNWAFARGRGGRFLLRIEDTDRARSTEAAERGILDDLRWLGIDWDNDTPPRQSQRRDLYHEWTERLLKSGRAYEDGGAVRFRMPGRAITVQDQILGEVTVPADRLEDFIIRKSDGYPTYHFAVVVDDADMAVTHVIRGQEHLNNTPKHWALQEALDLPHPTYGHLPVIMNADGSKMSKRDKAKAARKAAREWIAKHGLIEFERLIVDFFSDGPPMYVPGALGTGGGSKDLVLTKFIEGESDDLFTAAIVAYCLRVVLPEIDVHDFRESGYLPEALCNYLALLGWNPGGNVEKFDNEFLAANFGFERVGKANSRFDREKLFRFNADGIKELRPEEFARRWREYCRRYRPDFLGALSDEAFGRLAAVYQPRSRTLAEPCDLAQFFIAPDEAIQYDEKAVEKNLAKNDGQGLSILRELAARLEHLSEESFGAAAHDLMKSLAEEKSIGMGKVAQPLRVAVSGGTVTPENDATLDILGKPRTLNRIRRCLDLYAPATKD